MDMINTVGYEARQSRWRSLIPQIKEMKDDRGTRGDGSC